MLGSSRLRDDVGTQVTIPCTRSVVVVHRVSEPLLLRSATVPSQEQRKSRTCCRTGFREPCCPFSQILLPDPSSREFGKAVVDHTLTTSPVIFDRSLSLERLSPFLPHLVSFIHHETRRHRPPLPLQRNLPSPQCCSSLSHLPFSLPSPTHSNFSLTQCEQGSKNHELVPLGLIAQLSGARSGGVNKALGELAKKKLVGKVQNAKCQFPLPRARSSHLRLSRTSRANTEVMGVQTMVIDLHMVDMTFWRVGRSPRGIRSTLLGTRLARERRVVRLCLQPSETLAG